MIIESVLAARSGVSGVHGDVDCFNHLEYRVQCVCVHVHVHNIIGEVYMCTVIVYMYM